MKKYFFVFSLFFFLSSIDFALASSREFPSTEEKTVAVFADQLPAQSMTNAQFEFAAEHYVGTQKLYKQQIEKIREYNPNFLLLHYRLAQAAGPAAGIAHQNETIGQLNGNEFSSEEWNTNLENKDWFIKNTQGQKIQNTQWNWYPFDLSRTNSLRNEIAGYWASRVKKEVLATQSDGVFADSFGLVFGPWNVSGIPGFAYDSSWRIDALQAQEWLRTALVPYSEQIWTSLRAEGIYYIPNCGQLITSWDTVENYMHSDGCMVEGFMGFEDSIDTIDDWILELNNILALQNKGKVTIAQTAVQKNDLTRRSFIVGSYLLSKGEKSYLNMLSDSGVALEWFPEYDLDLGAYESSVTDVTRLEENGVYRRNFEKGFVLVNPGKSSKTVSLQKSYKQAVFSGDSQVSTNGEVSGTVTYKDESTVTLAPLSAAFFLSSDENKNTDHSSSTSCALLTDQAYKSPSASAVYYVDLDCKKRPFSSSMIFFTYFDSWEKVKVTTQTLLNRVKNHELGFMPLGPKYDPKYGALVKIVTDPKVYFLLNGKKYWITSESVFNKLRYKWNWVEDIDPRLLEKYKSGGEITDTTKHLDGTIVKYEASPEVYVIENGKKRHIQNEAEFNALGYRWDRIVIIPVTEKYGDVGERQEAGSNTDNLPPIRIIGK